MRGFRPAVEHPPHIPPHQSSPQKPLSTRRTKIKKFKLVTRYPMSTLRGLTGVGSSRQPSSSHQLAPPSSISTDQTVHQHTSMLNPSPAVPSLTRQPPHLVSVHPATISTSIQQQDQPLNLAQFDATINYQERPLNAHTAQSSMSTEAPAGFHTPNTSFTSTTPSTLPTSTPQRSHLHRPLQQSFAHTQSPLGLHFSPEELLTEFSPVKSHPPSRTLHHAMPAPSSQNHHDSFRLGSSPNSFRQSPTPSGPNSTGANSSSTSLPPSHFPPSNQPLYTFHIESDSADLSTIPPSQLPFASRLTKTSAKSKPVSTPNHYAPTSSQSTASRSQSPQHPTYPQPLPSDGMNITGAAIYSHHPTAHTLNTSDTGFHIGNMHQTQLSFQSPTKSSSQSFNTSFSTPQDYNVPHQAQHPPTQPSSHQERYPQPDFNDTHQSILPPTHHPVSSQSPRPPPLYQDNFPHFPQHPSDFKLNSHPPLSTPPPSLHFSHTALLSLSPQTNPTLPSAPMFDLESSSVTMPEIDMSLFEPTYSAANASNNVTRNAPNSLHSYLISPQKSTAPIMRSTFESTSNDNNPTPQPHQLHPPRSSIENPTHQSQPSSKPTERPFPTTPHIPSFPSDPIVDSAMLYADFDQSFATIFNMTPTPSTIHHSQPIHPYQSSHQYHQSHHPQPLNQQSHRQQRYHLQRQQQQEQLQPQSQPQSSPVLTTTPAPSSYSPPVPRSELSPHHHEQLTRPDPSATTPFQQQPLQQYQQQHQQPDLDSTEYLMNLSFSNPNPISQSTPIKHVSISNSSSLPPPAAPSSSRQQITPDSMELSAISIPTEPRHGAIRQQLQKTPTKSALKSAPMSSQSPSSLNTSNYSLSSTQSLFPDELRFSHPQHPQQQQQPPPQPSQQEGEQEKGHSQSSLDDTQDLLSMDFSGNHPHPPLPQPHTSHYLTTPSISHSKYIQPHQPHESADPNQPQSKVNFNSTVHLRIFQSPPISTQSQSPSQSTSSRDSDENREKTVSPPLDPRYSPRDAYQHIYHSYDTDMRFSLDDSDDGHPQLSPPLDFASSSSGSNLTNHPQRAQPLSRLEFNTVRNSSSSSQFQSQQHRHNQHGPATTPDANLQAIPKVSYDALFKQITDMETAQQKPQRLTAGRPDDDDNSDGILTISQIDQLLDQININATQRQPREIKSQYQLQKEQLKQQEDDLAKTLAEFELRSKQLQLLNQSSHLTTTPLKAAALLQPASLPAQNHRQFVSPQVVLKQSPSDKQSQPTQSHQFLDPLVISTLPPPSQTDSAEPRFNSPIHRMKISRGKLATKRSPRHSQ